MTKEMREIIDQLNAIEERANSLAPLAETAEEPEIEAREKELADIAEQRKALEEKKAALEAEERAAEKLAENPSAGTEVVKENRGEGKMDVKELRNSPEYIEAFAKAIKGNDDELRALLTENAVSDGQVPIPTFAEESKQHGIAMKSLQESQKHTSRAM